MIRSAERIARIVRPLLLTAALLAPGFPGVARAQEPGSAQAPDGTPYSHSTSSYEGGNAFGSLRFCKRVPGGIETILVLKGSISKAPQGGLEVLYWGTAPWGGVVHFQTSILQEQKQKLAVHYQP